MEQLFKPTLVRDPTPIGIELSGPQPVPVFQYHAPADGGGWKYYYGLSPSNTSGWVLDGIVFWAYLPSNYPPGAVPIYQYYANDPSGQRYYYGTSPNNSSGWTLGGVAFYADPNEGGPTTVPIYQYHALNGDGGFKYYYGTSADNSSGWILDGPVFYCCPPYENPSVAPVYEYHAPASDGGWKYYYGPSPFTTSGWTLGGVAFFAPAKAYIGMKPVYEFVSEDSSGQSFYYAFDPTPPGPNWSKAGVAFFAYEWPYATNAIPIYRFYAVNQDGLGVRYYYGASQNVSSGWINDGIAFYCFPNPISYIFVLMLENRSFDNIFALSGIPGIKAATKADSNENNSNGATYSFGGPAPVSMATDPGHEFNDVLQQLTNNPPGSYVPGDYPAISNSGFVNNYANSTSEGTGTPPPDRVGDIISGFQTNIQLPVIFQLASEFAICDQWFSSLPGPTWPNRFFVHGASSSGMDDSPSRTQILNTETFGFTYNKGSIYDALNLAHRSWSIYNDYDNSFTDSPYYAPLGGVPQVSALEGVSFWSVKDIAANFIGDLNSGYNSRYTFIEPNYGNILFDTYSGGSSQHPMDDTYGGENLIKFVYEAIRTSPIWNSSLLIITYDEHGGFYDSVAPGPATAPNDGSINNPTNPYNKNGFDFTQYGVRVPAVVISPYIQEGIVADSSYDHASVLATVERTFGLNSLTSRDATANDLLSLLSRSTPRSNCPLVLNNPVKSAAARKPPLSEQDLRLMDLEPLPESGNLIGFLAIYHKADLEMSSGLPAERAAIVETFKNIKTKGEARVYMESVRRKIEARRRP
jgi:phospholipase C